jgi:coenzyme F420-reducing hydrogenase delta subunit
MSNNLDGARTGVAFFRNGERVMSKSFDIANREFDRLQRWIENLHTRTIAAREHGRLGDHLEEYVDEFEQLKADFQRLTTALGLAAEKA